MGCFALNDRPSASPRWDGLEAHCRQMASIGPSSTILVLLLFPLSRIDRGYPRLGMKGAYQKVSRPPLLEMQDLSCITLNFESNIGDGGAGGLRAAEDSRDSMPN
jgi:hypothetical protein